MNDPLKTAVAADEQASLWAARLDAGDLSAADRAELEAWRAAAPAHAALLARYTEFSADLGLSLAALAAVGLVAPPARPPRRSAWLGWSLALGGAAAVALGAVVWFGRAAPAESLSAPAGARRTFTLSDGSKVELNANTSVVIENSRSERRVRLANGEAFFEVSKDKSRPFTVETPAGSVRVTGTKFSVLTENPTQLDVTVLEGSVQVRAGAAIDAPTLHHGDQLTTTVGGVALHALSDEELEDALAWRQGQIVCNGLPLGRVLERFAHYHGRVITASAAAAAVPVGSRYNLGDLDAFLAQLEQGLKMRVTRAADGSIRVSELGEP